MVGKNSYLFKDSQVLYTPMGDDAVLMHVQRGDYYSLNKVGARLWTLADGQKNIIELAQEITDLFHISQEEAENDILDLARQMHREGLVIVSETPANDNSSQISA